MWEPQGWKKITWVVLKVQRCRITQIRSIFSLAAIYAPSLLWRILSSKLINQINNTNAYLTTHEVNKLMNNSTEYTTITACVVNGENENLSVMSDSLWPRGLYSPRNSPGQDTGVDSLSLLQGIFPTQGLNPGLLHFRQTQPSEPPGKPWKNHAVTLELSLLTF